MNARRYWFVAHITTEAARIKLNATLNAHPEGKVIIIAGLSGAGKTSTRDLVLTERFAHRQEWSNGAIPVASVMAARSQAGFFDYKGLAISANLEMLAPDVSWADAGGGDPSFVRELELATHDFAKQWAAVARRASGTEGDHLRQFLMLARTRRLRVMSIENASALCATRVNGSPAEHVLNLMSLSEKARIITVLAAIDDAYKLWEGFPELRRRAIVIWIKPYDLHIESELKECRRILKTIAEREFCFESDDELRILADDVIKASAGVTGEMIAHLERAHLQALSRGGTLIRRSDIEEAFYGTHDVLRLNESARILRERIAQDNSNDARQAARKYWGGLYVNRVAT